MEYESNSRIHSQAWPAEFPKPNIVQLFPLAAHSIISHEITNSWCYTLHDDWVLQSCVCRGDSYKYSTLSSLWNSKLGLQGCQLSEVGEGIRLNCLHAELIQIPAPRWQTRNLRVFRVIDSALLVRESCVRMTYKFFKFVRGSNKKFGTKSTLIDFTLLHTKVEGKMSAKHRHTIGPCTLLILKLYIRKSRQK